MRESARESEQERERERERKSESMKCTLDTFSGDQFRISV